MERPCAPPPTLAKVLFSMHAGIFELIAWAHLPGNETLQTQTWPHLGFEAPSASRKYPQSQGQGWVAGEKEGGGGKGEKEAAVAWAGLGEQKEWMLPLLPQAKPPYRFMVQLHEQILPDFPETQHGSCKHGDVLRGDDNLGSAGRGTGFRGLHDCLEIAASEQTKMHVGFSCFAHPGVGEPIRCAVHASPL
jgi:hypothetical protein